MHDVLVIVPCGSSKIWSKQPDCGPIAAADAYIGTPFKLNREYAECFGAAWVVLSAKYGFVLPEFEIPESYEVTLKRASTHPVTIEVLERQNDRSLKCIWIVMESSSVSSRCYRPQETRFGAGMPASQMTRRYDDFCRCCHRPVALDPLAATSNGLQGCMHPSIARALPDTPRRWHRPGLYRPNWSRLEVKNRHASWHLRGHDAVSRSPHRRSRAVGTPAHVELRVRGFCRTDSRIGSLAQGIGSARDRPVSPGTSVLADHPVRAHACEIPAVVVEQRASGDARLARSRWDGTGYRVDMPRSRCCSGWTSRRARAGEGLEWARVVGLVFGCELAEILCQ